MVRKPYFSQEEVSKWFEDESGPGENTLFDSVEPSEKYARSQLRVVRETKDYQLDYIKHAFANEKINSSPFYQRRLRWSLKQRSLLIESFLLNIPIPPIFLYETDYNEYEIIDGRQRVESVRDFLDNDFALVGLEYWKELERKKYKDLPSVLQKGLLRRSISAIVLLAETSEADEEGLDVRRVLFDRLNTGGIRLNPQELRNALYPGTFNSMLKSLARSLPFTIIWGIPPYEKGEKDSPSSLLLKNNLYSTFADAELVLRFFALRDAIEHEKKGALRQILDRYMKDMSNAENDILDKFREEFIALISMLYDIFDRNPFKLPKTTKPSRPLYDALMIALSMDMGIVANIEPSLIRKALASALSLPESYDILVGRGNTIESVRKRVKLAQLILRGHNDIDLRAL